MTSPTFTLPACPVCSSVFNTERPTWRKAQRTSRKRGHACYMFTGCAHAVGLGEWVIRDTEDEWKIAEEAWEAEADRLFALVTKDWPEATRERLRRIISISPFANQLGLKLEPAQIAEVKHWNEEHPAAKLEDEPAF